MRLLLDPHVLIWALNDLTWLDQDVQNPLEDSSRTTSSIMARWDDRRTGLRSAILDLYRAFPNFMAVVELVAIDDIEADRAERWRAVPETDQERRP